MTGETPVVDIQSSQRQHGHERRDHRGPAGRAQPLRPRGPRAGAGRQQFGRVGWQDVGGTNNLQIAAMSIHGGTFLDTTMAVNGLSSRNLLSSIWATNFIADTGTAAEWTINYAGQGAESASSGVTFDMIPKDGGNRFSGSVFATGANENFQSNNYTEELKAKGLRAPGTPVPDVRHQPVGRRSDPEGQTVVLRLRPLADEPDLHPGLGRQRQRRRREQVALGGRPTACAASSTRRRTAAASASPIRRTRRTSSSFSHEPQSRHWIDATRGDVARVVHRLPLPRSSVHELGGLDGTAHATSCWRA